MAGDTSRAVDLKNELVLPVIVLQTTVLFPSTFLKINEQFQKQTPLKLLADETKYLTLKNDAPNAVGPGRLWEIGCVCSLQKKDDDFWLSGESRAEVIKIWLDKKRRLLVASIRELEDIPTVGELTDAELPMLFGCVESILRFFRKWQEKVPENEAELHKKIKERIVRIESERRQKETIYSLPWHVLVVFSDFFSFDFKEEMLRTNKVIDRLLSVAEKLQREISAFQFAGSFADADTESPVKLENGAGDK